MKELCLVTYTRSDEGFTEELDKISNALFTQYKDSFKVVVCCENNFEIKSKSYDIEQMQMSGTKYRRLISLLERDDSKYYLSVDNDITGNIDELLKFVNSMIVNDYEVGWGRIRARKQKGFISNMVAVDKLLSHNIIRPLLWKMGFGISIPGQIFCIRGESYRGKLIQLDTFLDDLALGLYVNIHESKKYVISSILGFEEPNSKFGGLWNQRKRWAIGYASILKAVKKQKDYKNKVFIHGSSYHFSWIINWLLIALLAVCHWPLAVIYVMFISLLISNQDISMFPYAMLYQFVFPVFHIRWSISFFNEMRKGD